MASVTLAESAKLAQDDLVAGVIENIITVNKMFQVLPFDAIDGNALAYNRESNIDNLAAPAGVGADLVNDNANYKRAAAFTQITSRLTKIIGDAEVDGLIQATRSGDGNDQKAVQVASKAKSIGREYQRQLIQGTGNNDEFSGLTTLVAGAQEIDPDGTDGDALSFEVLDNLMDLVIDKDGEVDYFAAHARTLREFAALLRGLGGASINDTVELPSGDEVPAYRGIPMFRNDYVPINETEGNASDATSIYAGTLDDGSRAHGIAGLTAANAVGIQVVEVGESETKDESITRVRWYCGLANFSEKGLAAARGIVPPSP